MTTYREVRLAAVTTLMNICAFFVMTVQTSRSWFKYFELIINVAVN